MATVYSGEIDGEILTLSPSGWTYRCTFVLFAYETESMWYHRVGHTALTCISGHYADRRLPELKSTLTRWNQRKAEHPETESLEYP